MPRSDKATLDRRIEQVRQMIIAGAEFADVQTYAAQQGWQVSRRQLRRYHDLAYKRMVKLSQRDREELLGRHLMQRRALYARCIKEKDYRTSLAVLRDEAALLGLYAPTKIAQTDTQGQDVVPKQVVELVVRSREEAIDFHEYRRLKDSSA